MCAIFFSWPIDMNLAVIGKLRNIRGRMFVPFLCANSVMPFSITLRVSDAATDRVQTKTQPDVYSNNTLPKYGDFVVVSFFSFSSVGPPFAAFTFSSR
jgi:hypothetical protein